MRQNLLIVGAAGGVGTFAVQPAKALPKAKHTEEVMVYGQRLPPATPVQ